MAFDGKSTLLMKNSIGHTRPLSRKMQASRLVVDLGQLVSNGWLMNVIMQNRLVSLSRRTELISATHREDIAAF